MDVLTDVFIVCDLDMFYEFRLLQTYLPQPPSEKKTALHRPDLSNDNIFPNESAETIAHKCVCSAPLSQHISNLVSTKT